MIIKLLPLLLLLTTSAYATTTPDKNYFTTKEVVRGIKQEPLNITKDDGGDPGIVPQKPTTPPTQLPDDYGFGDDNNTGGLDILDTFTRIWTIVEANKPVVTVQSATSATALPAASENDWTAIGGWKPERNITYVTAFKNMYGMTTVYLEYQVKVVYGGNVKGKGLYIASARIVPVKLRVLWGYKVDVTVSAPTVFNVRTPENPIAAIQLNVIYDIKTILNEDYQTDTYQVQGDGLIQDTKTGEVLLPAVLK